MLLNLHSLAGSRLPLCVACNDCGRRSTIPGQRVGAHDGNMKQVRDLKLKCSRCGSRSFSAYVMVTAKHVSDFEDGMPLEKFKGLKG